MVYLKHIGIQRLPAGAVIAKNSFPVNEASEFNLEPMLVLQKTPSKFNYLSGDWRYTTALPDRSIVEQTKGANADRVGFCIKCHLAAEKRIHLFPPRGPLNLDFPPKTCRRVPDTICCGLLRSVAGGAKEANQV